MFDTVIRAVMASGDSRQWRVQASMEPPWELSVTAHDGESWRATEQDLFRGLQEIRRKLDLRGVRLCCQGARLNVHPSGMSSEAGAGMIYLIHRWRPVTVRDMVPLFGALPAEKVATVEQQEAYWGRHLRAGPLWWIAIFNPIWWLYFLTRNVGARRQWREQTLAPGDS